MALHKFKNVFAVVIFVLICAHAVHPSTVVPGHAITKRSDADHEAAAAAVAGDTISEHDITKRSDTDHEAAGAAVAGDTISEHDITKRSDADHADAGAAVDGDTISGHAITKRGSETDHAAAGAAAAGDVMAATGGVIAAGSLSAGPFAPIVAGVGGVTAAAGGLVSIISRAADQSCREFGCHKNQCWAYCSIGNQWCYTTKSYSQSFDYVSCTRDDECNGCWKCAGSCTV